MSCMPGGRPGRDGRRRVSHHHETTPSPDGRMPVSSDLADACQHGKTTTAVMQDCLKATPWCGRCRRTGDRWRSRRGRVYFCSARTASRSSLSGRCFTILHIALVQVFDPSPRRTRPATAPKARMDSDGPALKRCAEQSATPDTAGPGSLSVRNIMTDGQARIKHSPLEWWLVRDRGEIANGT
jgi:hypothetical protein